MNLLQRFQFMAKSGVTISQRNRSQRRRGGSGKAQSRAFTSSRLRGLEGLEPRQLMATFNSLPASSDLVFDPSPANPTSGDEVVVGTLLSERPSPTELRLTYTISPAHAFAYDLGAVDAQINGGSLGQDSVILPDDTDSYVQTFPLSASDGIERIQSNVQINFKNINALQAQLPSLGTTRIHAAKITPLAYFDVTNVSSGIPVATDVAADTITLGSLPIAWNTGEAARVVVAFGPQAAPAATDQTADTVTFSDPHGLVNGNPVRVNQTGGGLSSTVTYFVHVTSPNSVRLYDSAANASAGGATGRIDLVANITANFSGLNSTGLVRAPVVGGLSSAHYFVRNLGGNVYQFYNTQAHANAGGTTGLVDILSAAPTTGQMIVLGERNDLDLFGQVPSATNGSLLTFPLPHNFVTGDPIQVSSNVAGLNSSTIYYVSVVSDTRIRLHNTAANAASGSNPLNYSGNVTSVISRVVPGYCWDADRDVSIGTEYFAQFWSSYQTASFPDTTRFRKDHNVDENGVTMANSALLPSSTNTSLDQITFTTNHLWNTGDTVAVTANSDVLTTGVTYFARRTSNNAISLYDTLANAQAGGTTGRVDLTTDITGSTTFFRVGQIKFSTTNLITGNRVVFDQTVSGVVTDQSYYVNKVDATTITIHNSRADALAGLNPVALTGPLPADMKIAVWEHLVEHPENLDAVNWLVNFQPQGKLATGIAANSTTTASGNVQPIATDFTTNETITLPGGHGFVTGNVVTVTANSGGLQANTNYYLNQVSGNSFSLHSGVPTPANRVNLTAAVTARITGDAVFFSSTHWTTGQRAQVSSTGGGLTAGVDYFVRALTPNLIGFYPSSADATNDTNRLNLNAPITASILGSFTTLDVQNTVWELLENRPTVTNAAARTRINELLALVASNVPLYQESIDYLPPAGGDFSIMARPVEFNATTNSFDSKGQLSLSLYPARLIPGYATSSQAFVDQQIPTLLAGLGDYVWEDLNKNGLQDTGEPGIPNVTVRLLDPNNNVLDTTTTNTNGIYQFLSLLPGSYKVQFVTPTGYTPTTSNAGNDALDSDPVNGITSTYTLVGGQYDDTIDAGYYRPSQLAITSFVDYGTGPCVASPAVIPAGGSLGFRIVITNHGTTVARGIKLNNLLPGGPTLPAGSGMDWSIDTNTSGSAAGTSPSRFRLSGPVGQEVLTFSNLFNGVLNPGQSVSVRVSARPTNVDALRGTPYGKAFDTTGTRAANLITLGAATNYLTFGLNGSVINAATAYIHGSAGIANSGSLNATSGSIVVGNVVQNASGQYVGSADSQVRGSIVTDANQTSQASADLLTASTTAKNFKPDFQLASITGSTTIRVTNGSRADGVTVVNVGSDINLNASELTLVGNPTDIVIVNVSGNMGLNSGSAVRLSGGLTANHVLFNLTGTNTTFTADNRSRMTGTLLGVSTSVQSAAQTVGAYLAGGSQLNLNSARISMGSTFVNTPVVTSSNAGTTSTTSTVILEPTDVSNWTPLTAAGRAVAPSAVDFGLLNNPFPLLRGERTVALVGDWSGAAGEFQARARDAITTLNSQLAAIGVHLTLQTNAAAGADFYLNLATNSAIGNRNSGLLGASNGASATLIRDWNWYTGANVRSQPSNRYDFQSAVTHELAHLIGFGHSSDRSSVMYRELSLGKAQRQFTANDLALMSVLKTPSSRAIDQVFARGGV